MHVILQSRRTDVWQQELADSDMSTEQWLRMLMGNLSKVGAATSVFTSVEFENDIKILPCF